MELLNCSLNSPSTKQTKLRAAPPALVDDDVDDSWGEAFFGLDIAAFKISHPLFREAIAVTKRSKPGLYFILYFLFVSVFAFAYVLIHCLLFPSQVQIVSVRKIIRNRTE